MKFLNRYRNKKWLFEMTYPSNPKDGEWYIDTASGHKREDDKKKTNSVLLQ